VGDDRRGHAVVVLLEAGHLEAVVQIGNVVALGTVAQRRLRDVLRAAEPRRRALGLGRLVIGLNRLGAAQLLAGERGGPHHAIAELARNAAPAHLVLGSPQPQELGGALHDPDRLGMLERARVLIDEHRANTEMRERQRCGQPRRSPADDQHRCLAAHPRLLACWLADRDCNIAAGTGGSD
jgi:hypothetical protein